MEEKIVNIRRVLVVELPNFIKFIFTEYSYPCQVHHRVLTTGITTTATASTHRPTRKSMPQLAPRVRIPV